MTEKDLKQIILFLREPPQFEIEVRWGGQWIQPSQWSQTKKRGTITAYVETRTGMWRWIEFSNRIFGEKHWRKI